MYDYNQPLSKHPITTTNNIYPHPTTIRHHRHTSISSPLITTCHCILPPPSPRCLDGSSTKPTSRPHKECHAMLTYAPSGLTLRLKEADNITSQFPENLDTISLSNPITRAYVKPPNAPYLYPLPRPLHSSPKESFNPADGAWRRLGLRGVSG